MNKLVLDTIKLVVPEILHSTLKFLYLKYLRGSRFSLNELDKKLERYVDHKNGFYVELGANDGFTQSNSYYFELKKNWRGVLIEPSPHLFMSCVKLRGKNNNVFCNACVGFDYKKKYVDMKYANLMTMSENLESDIKFPEKHQALSFKQSKYNKTELCFGSQARTLNDILDESNAPTRIDFISLDVEGAEVEVLKGIDYNKYKFSYMLIECRDIERLKLFLIKFDYQLIEKFSKHDYLFKYGKK